MGQQQLLLIVLGIVVVGLGVVTGIQLFGKNQQQAHVDEAHLRSVQLASEVAAWKMKPSIFGGGRSATGIDGVTVGMLGYAVTGAVDGHPAAGDGAPWRFAVRDAAEERPFVDVTYHRGDEALLSVYLFLFGDEERCWLAQTGRLQDGTMTWTEAPTAPAGCGW